MSKRVSNDLEVYVELSYGEYVMSAEDAALIQGVLANSTRVKKNWNSTGGVYEYALYTDDTPCVTTRLLDKNVQATIRMHISSAGPDNN